MALIKVPPTTLRLDNRQYKFTYMEKRDRMNVEMGWLNAYEGSALRPIVRGDECMAYTWLVVYAIYLGIPLIEVIYEAPEVPV